MRRFAVALLLVTFSSEARPAPRAKEWYPVEQTITRKDVPLEVTGDPVFGAGIDLSGRWLAISETVWSDGGEPAGSVDLFHRTGGKRHRPWRWRQRIDADSSSAISVEPPEFPLALEDDELAVAAPWPGGLVIHRLNDQSQWVESQTITEAFGRSIWPQGRLLMADHLLAFANIGGELLVFSRDDSAGEWMPDRSFPAGSLRRPNDFFLSGNRLVLIRAGSLETAPYLEVHRRSTAGSWLESEVIELFQRSSFFVHSGNLHVAFDRDDLVVLIGHTDFLGNPLGSTLRRLHREIAGWAVADEIEVPFLSSRVTADDGCVLVHGYATDFLGNPLIGQPAMLDRGFHRRGFVRAPVATVSPDGNRFATSALRIDFLGNAVDPRVTLHRNPWFGWFRRK